MKKTYVTVCSCNESKPNGIYQLENLFLGASLLSALWGVGLTEEKWRGFNNRQYFVNHRCKQHKDDLDGFHFLLKTNVNFTYQ